MHYRNLYIIGTSHVSRDSVKTVEAYIKANLPDIVAVELDSKRLHALSSSQKQGFSLSVLRRVGIKGYVFGVAGAWFERYLGRKVGVTPGAEMLAAVNSARAVKARVALVDQDIEVTLKRFSSALSWREKLNFLVDICKGLFFRERLEFDISKVPSGHLVEKLLFKVRKRYPNVYRVLVEERNHFMARRLVLLMKQNPQKMILAVLGAGHEKEILFILKNYLNRIDVFA